MNTSLQLSRLVSEEKTSLKLYFSPHWSALQLRKLKFKKNLAYSIWLTLYANLCVIEERLTQDKNILKEWAYLGSWNNTKEIPSILARKIRIRYDLRAVLCLHVKQYKFWRCIHCMMYLEFEQADFYQQIVLP